MKQKISTASFENIDININTACLFKVILRPNTSLSQKGFLCLMVGMALVALIVGLGFMIMGAWPVLGFLGLDIVLVYAAFKANYRWARKYERISLFKRLLLVESVCPSGRTKRWRLEPSWLQVEIRNPAEHCRQLVLSSRGRSLKIGSFLAPEERTELAFALRQALKHCTTPSHRPEGY